MKRLANIVTVARLFLAFMFIPLLLVDSNYARFFLIVVSVGMFLSDFLDGRIAKKYGSVTVESTGTVLDIGADNLVFVTVAIGFFIVDFFPLWLLLLVFWTRSLMTLARLVSLTNQLQFPGPRRSTRLKGYIYGYSLLTWVTLNYLEHVTFVPYVSLIDGILVVLIASATIVAACDFFWSNRHIVISLFKEIDPTVKSPIS